MPAVVAARPRDVRGYPVPAITPWPDGTPAFAHQSAFRTMICLAQRRCTVCGTKMPSGPVYRTVDGESAELIAVALSAGKLLINMMPAFEGPGHRACMIYSAVLCPYLASPGARRLPRSSRRTRQRLLRGLGYLPGAQSGRQSSRSSGAHRARRGTDRGRRCRSCTPGDPGLRTPASC